MKELPISFERGLYQAVIRFKQSHPGVLEDRTRERKEKEGMEAVKASRAGRPDRPAFRQTDCC